MLRGVATPTCQKILGTPTPLASALSNIEIRWDLRHNNHSLLQGDSIGKTKGSWPALDKAGNSGGGVGAIQSTNSSPGLFQYGSQRTPTKYGDPGTSAASGTPKSKPSPMHSLNSLTPLSQNSQRLLKSPRKPQRKVPKNPYKVRQFVQPSLYNWST